MTPPRQPPRVQAVPAAPLEGVNKVRSTLQSSSPEMGIFYPPRPSDEGSDYVPDAEDERIISMGVEDGTHFWTLEATSA